MTTLKDSMTRWIELNDDIEWPTSSSLVYNIIIVKSLNPLDIHKIIHLYFDNKNQLSKYI